MSRRGTDEEAPYASLAMYPFDSLRPAWERLWAAVHERAPWTPPTLRWTGDVRDHWVDPACHVAHACGWPVVTTLRGRVSVVGTFVPALDDADGHLYRSIFVANRPVAVADLLGRASTTVAASAADSLSGWVSLLAAAAEAGARWRATVRWTGGHVESLQAVRDGVADVSSVDELTLAHVRAHFGDLDTGLHEVGRGPWVPSLPVIVPARTPTALIDHLRAAIAGAIHDPQLAAARADLLIDSFVALDETAYSPLRSLVRSDRRSPPVSGLADSRSVDDAGDSAALRAAT